MEKVLSSSLFSSSSFLLLRSNMQMFDREWAGVGHSVAGYPS